MVVKISVKETPGRSPSESVEAWVEKSTERRTMGLVGWEKIDNGVGGGVGEKSGWVPLLALRDSCRFLGKYPLHRKGMAKKNICSQVLGEGSQHQGGYSTKGGRGPAKRSLPPARQHKN